ncbi:GIY-YIG nuclease family protein [Xylanimonas allomyrinae]|uniref:GIY-YIG nuclease family protein n=1 Tax=Xylanimonas allomyrinae TaxID=2509459 RepID=A0A4P6EK59_9MICO|nr:GIY-YIG nuclease family protein [Xylanimonas allomyrinae]QAY62974.1 GIY-YIG nuclease family protein [Xylanimonas allomyrinae]
MVRTAPPSSTLTLAHVLVAASLDPADVLLVRHPMSNPDARKALEAGGLLAYVSEQRENSPARHQYWLNFRGEEGNSARLEACYVNHGHLGAGRFQLEDSEVLADLHGRLVIDWGSGTRTWKQNGVTAAVKPVLAILERQAPLFPGFERLVLSFADLSEIIDQPRRYAHWHTAMASINAIYLIVDTVTGKQYIGSAYGHGGLLGRWSEYVGTLHGGDRRLIEELMVDPETVERFQYSVLQVLPKTATIDDVVAVETLYKDKLLTRSFGLNAN